MENDLKAVATQLRKGQAPGNAEILKEISVGIDPLRDFIRDRYMMEYIARGGAKIKFLTGKPGSGKTHFLQMLSQAAREQGFITSSISAGDVWLHDFKDIYVEILAQSDLPGVLRDCANNIIKELGYDPADIDEGMSFADYLSGIYELHAISKREIRHQLQKMFLKNPLFDNNFAIACSLLTGGILGHPIMENSSRDLLYGWMAGDRDIKLAAVRRLGLSPVRITKYNARHMLRSLSETLRMAGRPGLMVAIDNVEILADPGPLDTIRYTKIRREDAYESIRELIDDIDTLRNTFFIFAFDRLLLDDDSAGLKSYQALWMRIQNEIVSERFNMFTDIIDLDRYSDQFYTREAALLMSKKLTEVINRYGSRQAGFIPLRPISEAQASEIIAKTQFSKLALPRLINLATMENTDGTEGMEMSNDLGDLDF